MENHHFWWANRLSIVISVYQRVSDHIAHFYFCSYDFICHTHIVFFPSGGCYSPKSHTCDRIWLCWCHAQQAGPRFRSKCMGLETCWTHEFSMQFRQFSEHCLGKSLTPLECLNSSSPGSGSTTCWHTFDIRVSYTDFLAEFIRKCSIRPRSCKPLFIY